jgi:hypothetical protein
MSEDAALKEDCEKLGEAIDHGTMGDIVAKHEKMILEYYKDVKKQSEKSFNTAKFTAIFGFGIIVFSLFYVLIFDGLSRFNIGNANANSAIDISKIGLISGCLIEFIAAISFVLYARGARQFSTFHICLERTHRYLLAFKIAKEAVGDNDKILRDLVCIMANAPMISEGQSAPQRPSLAPNKTEAE